MKFLDLYFSLIFISYYQLAFVLISFHLIITKPVKNCECFVFKSL